MNLLPGEYLDQGFAPSLKKLRLEPANARVLRAFLMPSGGTPGPTLNGMRGAYWRGEFNKNDEAPVLSVTVPEKFRFKEKGHWFIGVLSVEQQLQRKDTARLCMETAEFAAPSIDVALNALVMFLAPVEPDIL